ncbi:MAG: ABC transporter ATP-binding protein [Chloroflexi bacterium]|nr:ABC transporter ATP-binding protein [Chloroflexota bacterium]MDA1148122.1 ABC transporter ATP-binding protein [Chloroflexota bacterium]
MTATPPALAIEGVRVRRGKRDVLRVSTLAVTEGETLAVLGPNGAGKSTLLLTAALLLPVTEGTVSLFGEAATRRHLVRMRRQTATVFQEPALLDMTVRRNLETALALHGVPRAERAPRTADWLERLGIAHLATAMPHTLSGGEARRVSLARAFAVRPRAIFLDEPFSALDLETRTELVGDLRALLREERTTALLVTHDHSEAQLLADRTAILIAGDVAQIGPTADLFERPASPAVAEFLGYTVVQAATLPPGLATTQPPSVAPPHATTQPSGLATTPPSDTVRRPPRDSPGGGLIGVPPSAVRLLDATSATSASEGYTAEVRAVQGALGQGRLLLALGEATIAAALPIEEIATRRLERGSVVRVTIDAARLVRWNAPA